MAFFYITSTGEANVRKSADYLPKMIELAGGTYIFKDLGDEDDAASTLSMQMEEFYLSLIHICQKKPADRAGRWSGIEK